MVTALRPHDAQALISKGEVDVVDVRDPSEFSTGHVPRARNVPLGELKADPRGKLPRDPVLLVCAKGVRSQTAAGLAEALGFKDVFQLTGGTNAWVDAGLELEGRPAPKAAPGATADTPDESCELPEPALDAVVGQNMKALRTERGLSLDQLARLTGLSRSVLGQIELGKTPSSVSVVWRIAQAFGVHFSALLATSERQQNTVLRAADAKRLVGPDDRFSSRALYPFSEKPQAEFYELYLAPHSREDAQAHAHGTRENLIVTSGRLELTCGSEKWELEKGDAIVFTADQPHSYVNTSGQECWMYLVMTYAR
ncbi:MAG: helix-turn-helix domain-containing protein [Archangiaceae bacterium]|nr:helix-turn-helix domain-containing protein [Archangiaceae bacterium]